MSDTDSTDDPFEQQPDRTFPVIFCDGVSSIGNSESVVKFYLYRMDPHTKGIGASKVNIFAQIVMPLSSFAETARFFNVQLQRFEELGLIRQEHASHSRPKPETDNDQ